MGYMAERFPDLSAEELGELDEIGIRFCQPVIDTRRPARGRDEPQDESARTPSRPRPEHDREGSG